MTEKAKCGLWLLYYWTDNAILAREPENNSLLSYVTMCEVKIIISVIILQKPKVQNEITNFLLCVPKARFKVDMQSRMILNF